MSARAIYANGEPWDLLTGGAISYYASRIFLTDRSLPTEEGVIPPRTLGLTISRWISGGMHEDLDITNDGKKAVKFQLEIALRCISPISSRSSGQHRAPRPDHHGLVHWPVRTGAPNRVFQVLDLPDFWWPRTPTNKRRS